MELLNSESNRLHLTIVDGCQTRSDKSFFLKNKKENVIVKQFENQVYLSFGSVIMCYFVSVVPIKYINVCVALM